MAHRNRWFTELKNGGSFHSYVSLPEGIYMREYQITSHFHDYDRLIEELNRNFHVEADLNLRFTLW